MQDIKSSRNYIIIKNKKELDLAKNCDVCGYIVQEDNNVIYVWTRLFNKWIREKYVEFGSSKDKDEETTGLKAYQSFYSYCGKIEVEKMKAIYKPISMWESCEQMHYANIDYMQQKIYQPIFEYDANSAFTYGVSKLPSGFELLKEYMLQLYDQKENALNKITRSKYKNLQNFLIGYFARVKEFVRVRSEIIKESNKNIELKMIEIIKNNGICYLSNTDSIVTDTTGSKIMEKYKGTGLGQFKLASCCDKLYYKSPNAYQLGEKIVYSGVGYFARQHVNLFEDKYATQNGKLLNGFNFSLTLENDTYYKLCRLAYGEITVTVINKIGEKIDTINYKLKGE